MEDLPGVLGCQYLMFLWHKGWRNGCRRETIHALIKQHLSRASLQMKSQADKKRTERQFAVGDWVFLKIQPYVQSSLSHRANQKLAFKFFSPFQIVQKIGPVA
jgi:hypothetical protein